MVGHQQLGLGESRVACRSSSVGVSAPLTPDLFRSQLYFQDPATDFVLPLLCPVSACPLSSHAFPGRAQ